MMEVEAGRDDARGRFVFTIDPEDAKDFDDAIEIAESAQGWRLAVHIADVAHYVVPGSAWDIEALKRGNTVYLTGEVLPMLPEVLSNDLCSLRPHEDRLVVSAVLDIDRAGAVRSTHFRRSIIHSAVRLTYDQALGLIHGSNGGEPGDRVRMAHRLAQTLRARRMEAGSLELDMPERKVRLNAEGHAVSIEIVPHDASHQLIEEAMLAANEAVARALKTLNVPALYRVHDKPDADKLAEFRALAGMHGLHVGDLTQRGEISKLLRMMNGRSDEAALKMALLRRLKRAAYSPVCTGHYGLAKSDYCHFTSPIRRYADLVVHRAVIAALIGWPRAQAPDSRTLQSIAEHVSRTEREAADAEAASVQNKTLELFQSWIDARTSDILTGEIVWIGAAGFAVALHEVPAEGFIPATTVRRKLRLGDKVTVLPARIDAERQRLELELVC